MSRPSVFGLATLLLVGAAGLQQAAAQNVPTMVEPPFLEAAVKAGELPPVAERIPEHPAVVSYEGSDKVPGQYGGTLRIIGGSNKDTRLLVIYGYARLVDYDENYEIVSDIAESFEEEGDKVFTFHLRPGQKWSDGEPFTSEDFRFYWEDMADNADVSRFGPPKALLVDGEKPKVEFPDAYTVRYSWSKPNPYFLPALAGAQPIEIFRPAHYLKQFHAQYAGLEKVEAMAQAAGERNWVSLLYSKDRSYRNDNVDYPTLEPWVLKTQPPSDRYIFARNPYYYRVDDERPAASLRRRGRADDRQRRPDRGQGGERRGGPARRVSRLLKLHLLEGGGGAQPLSGASLAGDQGCADRALPQPQRQRSGRARPVPPGRFPPCPVGGDRS